ncbi:MAG: glycosyltransferase family 4 protein [Verrucomicrobia subdivision 3 bacterium]|nr:glycosyltransferase family 4 protein [Limisphaerales bacterium]
MKIGFIRQRYVAIGGAEQYLKGMAKALSEQGHEIHVFANKWDGGEGFRFHHVPVIHLTSFLRALTFALNARHVVRHADCDLIFSLERTIAQDVYRAGDGCHREWLSQRAKYVGPMRNLTVQLNPFHRTVLALERRTFSVQCTRAVIANSHRGKREIVQHYGYPPERIHVIHNGVDCDRFRPEQKRPAGEEMRLLFAGTGFERKGLPFCIRALAELPANVSLQVAGKGDRRRYRALARRLGVENRVHFLGSAQDIAQLYRNEHVLVHPAIYEPFANVCLEAMASGLPVVTSRINGVSEIIEHRISGAIVEQPDDISALAGAIRPYLDAKFRAAASAHARAVAEAHPFAKNVEDTITLLRKLKSSV